MAGSLQPVKVLSGSAQFLLCDSTLTPSTNSALDAISAIVPKAVKPAYDNANGKFVFDLTQTNNAVLCKLGFLGTDAANETGTARVRGWHEARTVDSSVPEPKTPALYLPEELLNLAVTLGASQPAANVGQFTTSMFFADTIAITNDYTRGELAELCGPSAADVVHYVAFDAQGCKYLEVETAVGTATSLLPFVLMY